jgi:hypothetical protein
MPENTGKEIAPLTEFEVLEQVDDQAIVQMMTGQAIKDYVYSFKQGGKVVEGLTLAGINEAANRRGGIEVDTLEYEEREKSWIAVVKAIDTITGSSRYGACEQPKNMGTRPDPHAFTKAIHKAQRNAIKQLLPVPVIKEVLNYYLHRQHETTPLATGPTKEEKLSNAQKATFALASELKDRMEQQNIDQASFWQYVRARYAVGSRNEMSEMQWTQLAAELQAASSKEELLQQFIERIKKISAATEESEVTTTQPPEAEAVETVVVVEAEPASPGERPSALPF